MGLEVRDRTEQGGNERTGTSPAAGLFPVEVDWPALKVKVVVGELPLWWAGRERGGGKGRLRGQAYLPNLISPSSTTRLTPAHQGRGKQVNIHAPRPPPVHRE